MGVVSRPAKSSLRSLLPLRSRLVLVPGGRPGFREPFHCSWNISHIGRLGHVLPSVGQSLTGVEGMLGLSHGKINLPCGLLRSIGKLVDWMITFSLAAVPCIGKNGDWGVAGKGLWVRRRE